MRLPLLESGRSFLGSAECALLSILAHAGLVGLANGTTAGSGRLPADEREARVFFLLPPDRVDAPLRQADNIHWKQPGGDLAGGTELMGLGGARALGGAGTGARRRGQRSRVRGDAPFGPAPNLVMDSVFSVLQVDEMVERYEGSAAPVYPPDLIATGTEGQVQATYVVDSVGRVDTTTIQVVQSDDPRFTESVRTALGGMRFRPAKRGGKAVRQLVSQRFRFQIQPSSQTADRNS
jgi:TonB family protein